jgi:hypothetical protein
MVPPQAFMLLTDWLELPKALSRLWWTALTNTPWSAATQLRSMVLMFEARPQSTDHRHLIHTTFAPSALVEALEACWRCGQLSRRDASTIEERILRYTKVNGEWG